MNKKYCCYKITDITNGKVYIGKTLANTTRRWRVHISCAESSEKDKQYIHNVMAKRGIDNFTFEVLKYYETEEQAYAAETKYIKKYNSYGDGGYNSTPGGKGFANGPGNRKLNNKQVKSLIKDYIFNDLSSKDLMHKYNLAKSCVLDILHRRSYMHVNISDKILYQVWLKLNCSYQLPKRFNEDASFIKLKEIDIKNIFKDFVTGQFSFVDLSEKYKVMIGNIVFILNRETWVYVKIHHNTLKKAKILIDKINENNNYTTFDERLELKQKIFEDFSNGISKKNIATKYDLALERIVKVLNGKCWRNINVGTPPEKARININKNNVINIIKYFCENNVSIKEVSNHFNINESKIRSLLYRETFKKIDCSEYEQILSCKLKSLEKLPLYNKIDIEDIKEIIMLHKQGTTINEISRKFNYERHAVSKLIKENLNIID